MGSIEEDIGALFGLPDPREGAPRRLAIHQAILARLWPRSPVPRLVAINSATWTPSEPNARFPATVPHRPLVHRDDCAWSKEVRANLGLLADGTSVDAQGCLTCDVRRVLVGDQPAPADPICQSIVGAIDDRMKKDPSDPKQVAVAMDLGMTKASGRRSAVAEPSTVFQEHVQGHLGGWSVIVASRQRIAGR